MACCIVFSFALRGAGDTRVPVLFTWIGFLGVRLPLAYLFTQGYVDLSGLGTWLGGDPRLFGAWLAMFADLLVRGVADASPLVKINALVALASYHDSTLAVHIAVVLHLAGPFSRTSKPMLDACLRTSPRISATRIAIPEAADTKFCTVNPNICVR